MEEMARVHVGLHKTASTFLQRDVFPEIEGVVFNPPGLHEACRKLWIRHRNAGSLRDRQLVEQGFVNEARMCSANTLLSHEGLAGNPYSNFREQRDIASAVKRGFPNATCLVVLRHQPDWLLSLYKQILHEGQHATLNAFLNYENGSFEHARHRGHRNVDALDFDFSDNVATLEQVFGVGRVHVVFYEELTRDPQRFVARVCQALDVDIPLYVPSGRRNRGFSALAVNVTLAAKYVPLPAPLRKRWRGLMQKKLDKYMYVDWDLLGRKRAMLAEHYAEVNRTLDRFFPDEEIRGIYTA